MGALNAMLRSRAMAAATVRGEVGANDVARMLGKGSKRLCVAMETFCGFYRTILVAQSDSPSEFAEEWCIFLQLYQGRSLKRGCQILPKF